MHIATNKNIFDNCNVDERTHCSDYCWVHMNEDIFIFQPTKIDCILRFASVIFLADSVIFSVTENFYLELNQWVEQGIWLRVSEFELVTATINFNKFILERNEPDCNNNDIDCHSNICWHLYIIHVFLTGEINRIDRYSIIEISPIRGTLSFGIEWCVIFGIISPHSETDLLKFSLDWVDFFRKSSLTFLHIYYQCISMSNDQA